MKPLRVLVVDDDWDTTESTSDLIRSLGHNALSANSAETALAHAPSCRPDVMLIDLAMPKFDGLELAKRLRKQPQFAETPLVAISGYVDLDHRQLALDAGFEDFLAKPFLLCDLQAVFHRVQGRVSKTQNAIEQTHAAVEASRELNRQTREALDEFWRNHRRHAEPAKKPHREVPVPPRPGDFVLGASRIRLKAEDISHGILLSGVESESAALRLRRYFAENELVFSLSQVEDGYQFLLHRVSRHALEWLANGAGIELI